MELRSRSRSRTPFSQHKFEEEGSYIEGTNHVTVSSSRTTRQSTIIKTSGEVSSSTDYITRSGKNRSKTESAIDTLKTSDYSSEEGEFQTKHITQNQKNQIIEDARAAANGNSQISALDLYRKAGRYWDKYPKTDWTYSPHSQDRVEIAPGVVQMPNMSRPPIHTSTSYLAENHSWASYSGIKKRLFSAASTNNEVVSTRNTILNSKKSSNYKDSDSSFQIIRRSAQHSTILTIIKSVFLYLYTSIISTCTTSYKLSNWGLIWLAKQIYHFTSWVMLLDTWLMIKRTRGGSKRNRLIGLCLIPFLLCAGWFLLSTLAGTISTTPLFNSASSNEAENYRVPLAPPSPAAPSSSGSNSAAPLPSPILDVSDELIMKILAHPQLLTLLMVTNDNSLAIIRDLQDEIAKIRNEFSKTEQHHKDDLNRIISQYRIENRQNIARLSLEMKKCCHKPELNLESHITNIVSGLLNSPDFLSNQHGLHDYLHSVFIAKRELDFIFGNLTERYPILSMDFDQVKEEASNKILADVLVKLSGQIDPSGINDQQIMRIVKKSLAIYDADKTGLVDYAMETMGGQVLTTRCTESYHAGTAVVSILGMPLWYPSNTPRTVITPGINPGECWAFQNFPGFLVIRLAHPIKVEAFSLEHISRLLVPDGRIDSAPKEFEVYGLKEENDRDPVLLGQYEYDYNGEPLQYFAAHQYGLVFDIVELRIKSNHGNPNYTCLYRFRVHGSSIATT